MTTLIPIDSEKMEKMEKVNELSLQGFNATEISKSLGIQRKVVVALIEEWRAGLARDPMARERAREALTVMDTHYTALIKKAHSAANQIETEIGNQGITHQLIAQKLNAIKTIAELEAKRLDALHKAGLLENNDLADELADMEEKHAILVGILRTDLCPACRSNVAQKLQKVTQQVEVTAIYDEEGNLV